jgi:hypothetical protein
VAQSVPRLGVVPLAVVIREGGGTVRVMSIRYFHGSSSRVLGDLAEGEGLAQPYLARDLERARYYAIESAETDESSPVVVEVHDSTAIRSASSSAAIRRRVFPAMSRGRTVARIALACRAVRSFLARYRLLIDGKDGVASVAFGLTYVLTRLAPTRDALSVICRRRAPGWPGGVERADVTS